MYGCGVVPQGGHHLSWNTSFGDTEIVGAIETTDHEANLARGIGGDGCVGVSVVGVIGV